MPRSQMGFWPELCFVGWVSRAKSYCPAAIWGHQCLFTVQLQLNWDLSTQDPPPLYPSPLSWVVAPTEFPNPHHPWLSHVAGLLITVVRLPDSLRSGLPPGSPILSCATARAFGPAGEQTAPLWMPALPGRHCNWSPSQCRSTGSTDRGRGVGRVVGKRHFWVGECGTGGDKMVGLGVHVGLESLQFDRCRFKKPIEEDGGFTWSKGTYPLSQEISPACLYPAQDTAHSSCAGLDWALNCL